MTQFTPPTTAAAEHEGPTDFDEPDTGAVRHLRKAFGPGPANGESYVASAEDIARCLAANPQLRAAVLEGLPEFETDAEKKLSDLCQELRTKVNNQRRVLSGQDVQLEELKAELANSKAECLEWITKASDWQYIAQGDYAPRIAALESELAAERARAVRYQQERNHYRETALRSSQQPAPPPAEQAKDSAPSVPVTAGSVDATDGGGASPGEAKCKYCNRVGCESEQHRDDARLLRMCRHAVQLERDFLQNRVGRVEFALKQAESERDRLRAELEIAWSDENDPLKTECDELRTKLEAAEAERAHLREAAELLEWLALECRIEGTPEVHRAVGEWQERNVTRDKVRPSTAARSGSVGGEAAAAGEEKPWPQVGDVARLVSADSDITRSALRNEHLIGLAIGDEGTVSSLDDGCCDLLAGDGHTWTVATRDLRPSCLSAPEEPHCWCQRCEDDEGTISPFAARMKLCPHCGNKHCPKAEWHGYQCTGSNETGQVGVEEGKHPTQPPAPDSPGGGRDYCPKCDKCMVPMNGICNCGERLVEAPADYEARYVTAQPLTLADVDRRIAELARVAGDLAGIDHFASRRALERLQEAAKAGKP